MSGQLITVTKSLLIGGFFILLNSKLKENFQQLIQT